MCCSTAASQGQFNRGQTGRHCSNAAAPSGGRIAPGQEHGAGPAQGAPRSKEKTYILCFPEQRENRRRERKKTAASSTNGLGGKTPATTGAGESYPKVTHRFIHRTEIPIDLPSPRHRTILYPHRTKHLHVGFLTSKRHKHICTQKVHTENNNSAGKSFAGCSRSNDADRPPAQCQSPGGYGRRCRVLAHEPLDIVVPT